MRPWITGLAALLLVASTAAADGDRRVDFGRVHGALRRCRAVVRARDGAHARERVRRLHGRRTGLDPNAAHARRAGRRDHRLGTSARCVDRSGSSRGPARASISCCRGSAWPCAPARRSRISAPSTALVRALRDAKSIAYSASVSGTYLFDRALPTPGAGGRDRKRRAAASRASASARSSRAATRSSGSSRSAS